MLERIGRWIQPKNIAIAISEDKVMASEAEKGIYYVQTLSGIASDADVFEPIYIASAIQDSVNQFGRMLKRPNLLIAICYELTYQRKRTLVDILTQKWHCANEVLMLDYLVAAAIGTRIQNKNVLLVENLTKKIYILTMPSFTYMGLLFASGIIKAIKIPAGYETLEAQHINAGIHTLRESLPKTLPTSYKNIPGLGTEAMTQLIEGWKADINRHIYVTAPDEARARLGKGLDKFEFIYGQYDDEAAIKGVQAAIEKVYFQME